LWHTNEIPILWKRGNITPIFKKDEMEDPGQAVSALCLARSWSRSSWKLAKAHGK